ncbi:hypothetical protein BJY59DRAFT_760450, partial [Rhodotorula toruloides]
MRTSRCAKADREYETGCRRQLFNVPVDGDPSTWQPTLEELRRHAPTTRPTRFLDILQNLIPSSSFPLIADQWQASRPRGLMGIVRARGLDVRRRRELKLENEGGSRWRSNSKELSVRKLQMSRVTSHSIVREASSKRGSLRRSLAERQADPKKRITRGHRV